MKTLLILTHRCDRPPKSTLGDLFLNVFAPTDNLQGRVQGLDAEPANGEVVRRQITSNSAPAAFVRPLQRVVYAQHGRDLMG
jgi:hypothetical protein